MKFKSFKKYAALALAAAISLSCTVITTVTAAENVVLINDNMGSYAATSHSGATISTATGINGRAATDTSTRVQIPANSSVNGTDLRVYQEYTLPANFWTTASSTRYIVFSAWVYGSGFDYAGLQEANGEWFTPFFTPSGTSSWASGGWNKICFVYDRSTEGAKRGTTYAYINDVDVSSSLGNARTPWGQTGDNVTKIKFLLTNWDSRAMDVYFDDVNLYITDTMPNFSSDEEVDPNSLFTESFNGLSASMLTFYEGGNNPTTSLERGIGGNEYSDKSLKVTKNLAAATNIWANINQFIDPAVSCYTVEFDVYPQDDSFVGLGLAEGWNELTTDIIAVGDGTDETKLKKNEWNHVKFVVICAGGKMDGKYKVADLTTDVYVNGNLAIEGATKLAKFNGADNADASTYPLRIRLDATSTSDEFTVYLDNFEVLKIDATEISSTTLNSLTERNGRKILPTSAEIALTYSEDLNTSTITNTNVKLNGASVAVTVEDRTVTIKIDGLKNGKVYSLDLSETGWKDLYGRALPTEAIVFETVGKVEIGDAGLYSGDTELLTLSSGTITAKVTNLTNTTNEPQNVTAIMLLYKNGKIESRSQNSISVPVGDTPVSELTATITVGDMGTDDYVLKLFVWDSVSGGISYTDSVRIEN